jgi:hypothetical protein
MDDAIPPFDERGLLPPGTYPLTVAELRASHLVRPREDRPWDHEWRAYLAENLAILLGQLVRAGVGSVVVGGSFVEAKAHPADIDGYFDVGPDEVYSGRLQAALNELDPYEAWSWSALDNALRDDGATQLRMREFYSVELYPRIVATFGVVRPDGVELPFEEAFRVQRGTFAEKGVLRVRP